MTSPGRWTDDDIDRFVGRLLQAGVVLSAVTVLAAAAFLLARFGHHTAAFGVFAGEPARLRNIADIFGAAARMDPAALVQAGVVLLIATPIARVALTLVAFLVRRDMVFVALSGVVLSILLAGLISGRI